MGKISDRGVKRVKNFRGNGDTRYISLSKSIGVAYLKRQSPPFFYHSPNQGILLNPPLSDVLQFKLLLLEGIYANLLT